jgi:hypothetical protein
MSKTIIRHKNQEIEVVTRRGKPRVGPPSIPSTASPAPAPHRVEPPNLFLNLPRLSSVEQGRG